MHERALAEHVPDRPEKGLSGFRASSNERRGGSDRRRPPLSECEPACFLRTVLRGAAVRRKAIARAGLVGSAIPVLSLQDPQQAYIEANRGRFRFGKEISNVDGQTAR